MSSRANANLRRRWRRWLPRLHRDITNLLISRALYRGLREIVDANPTVQQPADIHRWIAHNYAITTSVAIRRLTEPKSKQKKVDPERESISLLRLLEEMEQHPGVLTWLSHRALYRSVDARLGVESARQLADGAFKSIALGRQKKKQPRSKAQGERDIKMLMRAMTNLQRGRPLGPAVQALLERRRPDTSFRRVPVSTKVLATDRQKLERTARVIRILVNKQVAHLDLMNRRRRVPDLHEVDAAIDLLEQVFLRYNKFLVGDAYPDGLTPTWQHDWQDVFLHPWIPATVDMDHE